MCIGIGLLKLIAITIFASILITLSGIIFPEFVYNQVKNEKIQKFLGYYLVEAYWILLTLVIDALLIVEFIKFIC